MGSGSIFRLTAGIMVCGALALAFSQAVARNTREHGGPVRNFDDVVRDFSKDQLESGRQIFRYDTFGDEAWWGGVPGLDSGAARGRGRAPATAAWARA